MNDYKTIFAEHKHILIEMFKNNGKRLRSDCGSYIVDSRHGHFFLHPDLVAKQTLLYNVCLNKKSVIETGTYLGHSVFIMLLANPEMNIITIDPISHYSKVAIETLQKHFPKATIKFIEGKSQDILPTLTEPCDLFHFDSLHNYEHVSMEIDEGLRINNGKINVVIDDFKSSILKPFRSEFTEKYIFKVKGSIVGMAPNIYGSLQKRI